MRYRFFDAPMAITSERLGQMLHDLRERFIAAPDNGCFDDVVRCLVEEEIDTLAATSAGTGGRSFAMESHVAIIPISGTLVHGSAGWGDETSYGALGSSFADAEADEDVRAIALQIGSHGGEVSGLFDLVGQISDKKSDKPVWAILDDHAYSAAYAIASAADRVTVPRTGGAGSIGVITMHLDMSKMIEAAGMKVSLIQYGERKTDHSPFKPLGDQARERLQADVNTVGEMFVDLVAKNRRMSRSKVRATEAGIYMGNDGVEAGLADAIQSPQEAFAALVARVK